MSDHEIARLGSVSYLPPMEQLEHVRQLGNTGYWAIFRSGPTTYVRSKLPGDHPLLEE
jgi:hypothetical protein